MSSREIEYEIAELRSLQEQTEKSLHEQMQKHAIDNEKIVKLRSLIMYDQGVFAQLIKIWIDLGHQAFTLANILNCTESEILTLYNERGQV